MDFGPGARVRLVPEDEYTHPIEPVRNFSESMYINVFDHARRMGGWFRVANRPNEGRGEMSCALYLPDGSAGFMFQRPEVRDNSKLAAAGMAFEVIEPLARLRVTYDGNICRLKNPGDMADPKKAFSTNPIVACRIQLEFRGISPVYGGEHVDAQGKPIEERPEEAFARAHYEQHVHGEGTITLGDETFPIAGLGLRDHSWGPRYWQNLYWYRWLPLAFSEDFAMVVSVVTLASGTQRSWGMVLRKGAAGQKDYVPMEEVHISSSYDERSQATAQTVRVRTREREYVVTGRALSLLPLRNVRKTDEGRELVTRITEAMTEFRCDGQVGYGMSEYLDQMVHGVPVGRHC